MSGHHRRSPRPVSFAIARIEDELAPDTLLASVQRAWREAVGEAAAAHARPTAERGGVITVSCSESVWAAELDLMGPAIVERLNSRLAEGRITRLRCVSVPPSARD
jgi:predicted nucleic acid-binding Zn ribbon protein